MNALDAAINLPLVERYREGTTVYAMLAGLAPGADLAELPSEDDVRFLGTWAADKQAEFDTVSEQLKRDPREMLRLRTEAKRALEIVKGGHPGCRARTRRCCDRRLVRSEARG